MKLRPETPLFFCTHSTPQRETACGVRAKILAPSCTPGAGRAALRVLRSFGVNLTQNNDTHNESQLDVEVRGNENERSYRWNRRETQVF